MKTGAEVSMTSFESGRWATNPGTQVPLEARKGKETSFPGALHGEMSGLWSKKLTPLWYADCLAEALGCQPNTILLLLWVGTIG